MKIYAHEIADGIKLEALQKATVLSCEIVLPDKRENYSQALFNDSKDSGLYDFTAILVSSNCNKNDDVFLKEELLASYKTPIDKQLNYMHNQEEIIGHITNAYVLLDDGVILSNDFDLSTYSNMIHIATSAVIYKVWEDPEKERKIATLISEINKKEWSVSMECMCEDFDYSVVVDGEEYILERTEESSFLTKYLRAFGGTGEYNGVKVRRVLRSIAFCGKGLVKNPANPNSQVLSRDQMSGTNKITLNKFLTIAEVNMEFTKEDFDKLNAEFTKAKEAWQTEKSKLEAEVEKASTLAKEATETLTQIQAEVKVKSRQARLTSAGVATDKIQAFLDTYKNTSDEVFEAAVSLYETKPTSTPAPKKDLGLGQMIASEEPTPLDFDGGDTSVITAGVKSIADAIRKSLKKGE